jgi:5'-deoxynucleotidase YfbR-like HD superfamily hydrolase
MCGFALGIIGHNRWCRKLPTRKEPPQSESAWLEQQRVITKARLEEAKWWDDLAARPQKLKSFTETVELAEQRIAQLGREASRMSQSRLQDLLALSIVPRWSIVPHFRPQSVAEHSFRVAAIALEIAQRLNKGVTPSSVIIERNVLLWALVHDGPEAETGDMPYPLKKLLPEGSMRRAEYAVCPWYAEWLTSIHPAERIVVKVADKIEEVLFLRDWGQGPKADFAMADAQSQILAHVEEARSRYGLTDLPAIVESILDPKT